MDFPTALPKSIYDAYIEGQTNKNALTKQGIENQFLGPSLQAQTASKLAYANLMGPQFLSKLMGNNNILANIPDEQKTQALNMLYNAGTGQGTGNAMLNTPSSPMAQGNPLLANNLLRQQSNLSQQDQQNISGMRPGDAVTIQGNQQAPLIPPSNKSFAENTGEFEGTIAQGKEAGSLRAKDVNDLGSQYETALDRGYAYNELAKITSNPNFQQMRSKIPFFQDKQLDFLAKTGTPEQQKMIGDFITSSQEIVKDTVNSFKGQRLRGELTVAQNMKISPSDTVNVALGKLQAAMMYNEMGKQRSQLASQYMDQGHMNKQKALEMADKQVNGEQIRQQIGDRLNPKPTDEDIQYMAQKYNTSPEEIKKRLKDKGKL